MAESALDETNEINYCECSCGEPVAKGKRFVQGHHLKKGVRTIEQPVAKDEGFVEECAQVVVEFIGGHDPDWSKRIAILMTDKGYNHTKALMAMCSYVLDRSLHLELPSHPYLAAGSHPFQEKLCEWEHCPLRAQGKPFLPKVAGQRFHSDECGNAFTRAKESQEQSALKPAPRPNRDIARTA